MDTLQLADIDIHDIGTEIQMAGTIWTGKGHCFVTLVPGKTEDFSQLKVMPLTLPEWETLIRQADLQEIEMFAKDPTGKLVKILFRKTQRQIDQFVQWAVFKRDHYACRYCGRSDCPLTVDHIDLYENGGASIVDNLLSACRPCNKDRGRLSYSEWLNSPLYIRKSRNLTPEQLQANIDLIAELPRLKTLRVYHVRSR